MLIKSTVRTAIVAEMATAAPIATTVESNTLPVLGTAQFVGRAPRHRVLGLVVELHLRNRTAIGAAGPNLYALANGTLAQSYPAFNDITMGLNGYYQAGAGWDYLTGRGSPQVWNLVQDFM